VSAYVSNSYVKIPPELQAEQVLEEVHSHLVRARESDPNLASVLDRARVRHRKGDQWVCLYEIGFKSIKESGTVELLRTITQNYVDEVVMLCCFGVVSFGAYAHFMEGTLVRFTAACEDWTESAGEPEPWESELIDEGGVYEATIAALGKTLDLRDVLDHSLAWDIDIPLRT
jgi:hypothetical protein